MRVKWNWMLDNRNFIGGKRDKKYFRMRNMLIFTGECMIFLRDKNRKSHVVDVTQRTATLIRGD